MIKGVYRIMFQKCALLFLITEEQMDELKKVAGEMGAEFSEVFWFTTKNDKKLYEVLFKNITLNKFFEMTLSLSKKCLLKEIKLFFKSKNDVLSLLEARNFIRYEEVDFVQFVYEKKAVKLEVIGDGDNYILKVDALDSDPNIRYFFQLIKRIIEIINKGADNTNEI